MKKCSWQRLDYSAQSVGVFVFSFITDPVARMDISRERDISAFLSAAFSVPSPRRGFYLRLVPALLEAGDVVSLLLCRGSQLLSMFNLAIFCPGV